MSLADRCIHYFKAPVRQRGLIYYTQRRVVLPPQKERTQLLAQVRGSDGGWYDVELRWSDAQDHVMYVECTCPYFEDHDECKHIWATIIQAGAAAGVTLPPGAGELDIVPWVGDPDGMEDMDPDEDEFDDPEAIEGWMDTAGRRRLARQQAKPREPTWRQRLKAISQPTTATPHSTTLGKLWQLGAELWFALDAKNSISRQTFAIVFLRRERKKNGGYAPFKELKYSEDDTRLMPRDAGELLQLLLRMGGADLQFSYSYYGHHSYIGAAKYSGSLLPHTAYGLMLPRLCATGRFVLRQSPQDDLAALPPLTWDGDEPWKLQLSLTSTGDADPWRIAGELRRGTERADLQHAQLILPSGWMVLDHRISRLDVAGNEAWLPVLQKGETIEVPRGEQHALVQSLYEIGALPAMEVPDELRWDEVRPQPRGRLCLAPHKNGAHQELSARIAFHYGEREFDWQQDEKAIVDGESRKVVIRDSQAERLAFEGLLELGFRHPHDHYANRFDLMLTASALPKVLPRLIAANWQVEAEGKLFRSPGKFEMSVNSGVDWFDLHGQVDFDGHAVALPALLAALARGEKFVTLDDGSQGMLPEAWLARYAPLAGLGKAEGESLRFVPSQVGILDALLAAEPEADVDAQFAQAREKLQAFAGVHLADQPESFQGQLREYQREGLGWLLFLEEFGFGGCLADDMGLGKTVQVLAFLELRRQRAQADRLSSNGKKTKRNNGQPNQTTGHNKPSLVVVPRSLVFNWLDEARRFTPELRVLDYTGLEREAVREQFSSADLVITTYGTLRRDIVKLKECEFDYVILDEAQAIKNAASHAAKACRLVRSRHRLAMSGTPIENRLAELWSLCDFLNPGMLGHSPATKLVTSAGRGEDAPESRKLLAHALRPFILRRTKEQVLKELPDKTEQTLYCELDERERKQYNEIRDHYRTLLTQKIGEIGLARSKIHVLEALLRLRQAACHCGLLDKSQIDGPSAKLDSLQEQLSEVLGEGHKALVFSQFTSLLAIVRRRLDEQHITYEYLDGKTRDRQKRVDRFQQDANCQLFLISLKAGGLGLNLTAADYVFILDPWWNPAVEAQAVDRAHRIGQTRPVFAYRLIARDTVEEKILELQRNKRDLADAIISADNSLIGSLSADDLRLLLS